jgi:hypothetical protein
MVQAVTAAGLARLVASSESLPGLTVGRQLVATVLGQPRNGLVLVSMFGRQLNVETALDLKPGQVLNLRVEALSPQIIMRPAPQASAGQSEGPPVNSRLVELVEKFTGQLEKGEVRDFELRNVVNRLLEQNDGEAARALKPLVDQLVQYPQAVALFLIPVNDENSSGRAVVAVEREGDEYVLRFRLDTDHIGRVSALARLGDSLKVEISVVHAEVAELMRTHLSELAERLEPLGLSELSVRLVEPNLNMLV